MTGAACCVALMGRFISSHIAMERGGMLLGSPPSALVLLTLTDSYILMGLALGMTYAVVVRAALVPGDPRYTLLLTGLIGIPLGVVWALPNTWFGSGETAADRVTHVVVVNFVVWWVFTTVVSYAISRIIFGLRAQVAAVRQLGQYTLLDKIGEGGMGAVYRAKHALMQRPTAIKLVSGKRSNEQIARFEREVQLTTRLTHPNTITIFDFGRTPDGIFYYVMELLDGASLYKIVEHGGPQPPERVVHVISQVAEALEEAHGIGLIHRDIKPENVILCIRGGRPDVAKLLDFGLVKDVRGQEDSALTSEADLTGTPLYMSPESITSPDQVDGRSDLYSLGAVAYFMLTGEHVFRGRTVIEVCSHHLHTTPTPPSNKAGIRVPEELETLVLDCLRKKPEERPQSPAELLERLSHCQMPWPMDRAREWWNQYRPVLASKHRSSLTQGTETIAVDLEKRPPGYSKH